MVVVVLVGVAVLVLVGVAVLVLVGVAVLVHAGRGRSQGSVTRADLWVGGGNWVSFW